MEKRKTFEIFSNGSNRNPTFNHYYEGESISNAAIVLNFIYFPATGQYMLDLIHATLLYFYSILLFRLAA